MRQGAAAGALCVLAADTSAQSHALDDATLQTIGEVGL